MAVITIEQLLQQAWEGEKEAGRLECDDSVEILNCVATVFCLGVLATLTGDNEEKIVQQALERLGRGLVGGLERFRGKHLNISFMFALERYRRESS
ncbi:MAG TPA: hypothetical protein DHV62_01275 [Elusimicrobia bacterium]|jgi:hypothetical protein|nr:hypothetical protein [Elusimicrobiota bacterium]